MIKKLILGVQLSSAGLGSPGKATGPNALLLSKPMPCLGWVMEIACTRDAGAADPTVRTGQTGFDVYLAHQSGKQACQ